VLKLLAGPERIEAGWWDDALAVRDYFIACNEANLLLWVYRERQGVEVEEPGWFLQGFF
jgi:protein ImuB